MNRRSVENRRQCYTKDGTAKKSYTKAQAKQVLQRWRKRRRGSNEHPNAGVNAYQCGLCFNWHIGCDWRGDTSV